MDDKSATSAVLSMQDAEYGAAPSGISTPQLSDADDALKVVSQNGPVILDEATNKRLLRQIDRRILPILCVVYSFNFLDKATLSLASVTGISQDLHLHGDDFSWLGSLFYISYLVFEYPVVRSLQRFPLAKWSGACVLGWGIIVACSAATSNFAGLAALRALLGVFEASVSPAWTLFTSQWYTKYEHTMRITWWFAWNSMADSLGSLLAYGIAQNRDHVVYALPAWKIIYILIGGITFVLGIVFLYVVPDKPHEARWLSSEDRVLVIERVRVNNQGIGNATFKLHQLREAFTDPAVWMFAAMAILANIPNGGIGAFFNLLIASYGYTDLQSLLLGAINGPVNLVACVLWAWTCQRYGYRLMNAFWFSVPGIAGSCLVVFLPVSQLQAKLFGFYLSAFTTPQFLAILSLIASNIAGYTKKTTVAGIFFIFYCAGNIIGPFTFTQSDAPRYIRAQTVVMVCTILCSLDLVLLHWWYARQNKRQARRRAAAGYEKKANQEFLDLTDRENAEFVYEL